MNWPEAVAVGFGVLGFLGFFLILMFAPRGTPEAERPRRRIQKSAVEKLTDAFVRDSFMTKNYSVKITHTYTPAAPPETKPLVTPPPASENERPN